MTEPVPASALQIIRLRKKPLVDVVWLGSLAWLLVVPIGGLPLASLILLFATLIIVPLGFDLIRSELADQREAGELLALCQQGQLPAALLLVAATLAGRGWLPAMLSLPWFLLTLLAAASGWAHVYRFWRETGKLPPADLAGFDIALIFLAIGGGWASLYLSGLPVLQFSAEIVQLTAVHFHYAGFALPIIATMAARASGHVLARGLLYVLSAATLLLAAGITASPGVEVLAALMLVAAVGVLAVMQIRLALDSRDPAVLVTLGLSGLAALCGGFLAAIYAIGEYRTARWLEIAQMIPLHGILMAGGFSLLGLLGWKLWSYSQP